MSKIDQHWAIKALAECYRLSGADPDGNEDWRLAREAIREVARLRKDFEAEREGVAALQSERDALKAALLAAQQFLHPIIPRGPEVDGWQNTVDLVRAALSGGAR